MEDLSLVPTRIEPQIPREPRVAIVGEAPGEAEAHFGKPFVGASGKFLKELLAVSGIEERECLLTNVFLERPEGNDLDNFLVPRDELPKDYNLPPLRAGLYVPPERLFELDRLFDELNRPSINLVIALGNTPLWALSGQRPAISKSRGYIFWNERLQKKVLPTYHPAAIFRQWKWKTVFETDLALAAKEREFPEIRTKTRVIHYNPTLAEVKTWTEWAVAAPAITIDLETARPNIITMFGFALSKREAFVIPLCTRKGEAYWSDAELPEVLRCLHAICRSPGRKICQNALYEIQWLWHVLNTPLLGHVEDTMTMQHALYQEQQKGLEFLGSIHSDVAHWKDMRKGKDAKRDS